MSARTKTTAKTTKATVRPSTRPSARARKAATVAATPIETDTPEKMPTKLPTVRYETITPEIALEMLGHNTHNRPIVESGVEQWARALRDGDWQLNHQGIAFDVDGVLMDGQHRLMAICDTGIPMTVQVTRNLPVEAFTTMDAGRKRTAAQVLVLSGKKSGALLASICRVLASYRESINEQVPMTNTLSRPRSNPEIVELAEKFQGLESVLEIAPKISKIAAIPSPAAVGAAVYQCMLYDARVTEDFVNGILTGEGLAVGDARLTLRNRAMSINLNNQKRGGLQTQAHSLNLMLGAFRAFSNGTRYLKAQAPQNLLAIGPTD